MPVNFKLRLKKPAANTTVATQPTTDKHQSARKLAFGEVQRTKATQTVGTQKPGVQQSNDPASAKSAVTSPITNTITQPTTQTKQTTEDVTNGGNRNFKRKGTIGSDTKAGTITERHHTPVATGNVGRKDWPNNHDCNKTRETATVSDRREPNIAGKPIISLFGTSVSSKAATFSDTISGRNGVRAESNSTKLKLSARKLATKHERPKNPSTVKTRKISIFGTSGKKAQPSKKKVASKTGVKTTGTRDVLFGSGIRKADFANKKAKVASEKARTTSSKLTFGKKQSNANTDVLRIDSSDDASKIKTLEPVVIGSLADDRLQSDIQLDEFQTAALNGGRNQKYFCLIGAAGTGKTTTVKQLVNAIKDNLGTFDLRAARRYKNNPDAPTPEGMIGKDVDEPEYNVPIAFVAFSGKAMQQIKRALPEQLHPMCGTIHSTLGYAPEWPEVYNTETGEYETKMQFLPHFDSKNKLPYKVIVVDEAGTVPIDLFNKLVAALTDDCRIILIGDINQLAPVTGRSVLGFAMLKWPTFVLDKIHRQAKGDAIIENAHRILYGKFPERAGNFAMKIIDDGSITGVKEIIMSVQYLHRKGNFDPLTDALIVPQNVGTMGQIALNEQLVRYFNPPRKSEDGTVLNPRNIIQAGFNQGLYAVGDKVMLLANNNDLGLTNGMTGVVQEIVYNGKFKGQSIAQQAMENINVDLNVDLTQLDLADVESKNDEDEVSAALRQASHIMKVQFQNHKDLVEFNTAGDYNNIAHAYAITCHKAQGSEYENVVVVCHASQHRMLTREWLYTAVTRAKRSVILLHNRRGLIKALKSQAIKGQTIEAKAESFNRLQQKGGTTLPNLGEPEEITDHD